MDSGRSRIFISLIGIPYPFIYIILCSYDVLTQISVLLISADALAFAVLVVVEGTVDAAGLVRRLRLTLFPSHKTKSRMKPNQES